MIIDINKYPKSKIELLIFTKSILAAFQKMSVQPGIEMPDITQEMAEQFMNTMFTLGPRNLIDFFDEQGVFISTIVNTNGFYYVVRGFESEYFTKRTDMEKAAYNKAFEILEATLEL